MSVKYEFVDAQVGLVVSEAMKTRDGDLIRVVRLSQTRSMIVGPVGSMPNNTTVIWDNPPDDIGDAAVVYGPVKKIANKLFEIAVNAFVEGFSDEDGDDGDGGGGGGNNKQCNPQITVIVNGDNAKGGSFTINCQ